MGPRKMAAAFQFDVVVDAKDAASQRSRFVQNLAATEEVIPMLVSTGIGNRIRTANRAVRKARVLKWRQNLIRTLLAACSGRPRSAFGGCAPRDLDARRVLRR